METLPIQFIILYILFPFIALVTGVTTYFLNKKIKLYSNKKAIGILLFSALILGLPGLSGWVEYWFMPNLYIIAGIFYLILGIYNLVLINNTFSEIKNKPYGYEFLFITIQIILGIGVFSLLFNITNELKYGLWASTCILPFIFISLYRKTFIAFLNIPIEIDMVWEYSPEKRSSFSSLSEYNEVIRIELSKKANDKTVYRINAESQDDLIFGEWFQHFLEAYNAKIPNDTIDFYNEHEPFGWIFYYKPSFFRPRKYINPDLSISQNKVNRRHVVIAKRVKQES